MRYKKQYDNDTGPNDDYFEEFWNVYDNVTNDVVCRCRKEDSADFIALILNTSKAEYRGFFIESESEPWALKYNKNYRFYKSEEKIRHAETIEEAKDEIDELTNIEL